jgi:prevent-host-death family protein
MTIASLAEVKAKFSAYIESCKTSPVVVTKNGKPAAVLVSVADDDELESILLACSPRFQKLLGARTGRLTRAKPFPMTSFGSVWKTASRPRSLIILVRTRRVSNPLGSFCMACQIRSPASGPTRWSCELHDICLTGRVVSPVPVSRWVAEKAAPDSIAHYDIRSWPVLRLP